MVKSRRRNGFYTIEALIAIVVFLVGIVGTLKIQNNAIATVSDAQYRINAAYLAESIIGQMWIDKTNLNGYVAGTGSNYTAWLQEVQASMPGVADNPPTITTTPTAIGTVVTVTIFWQKPGNPVSSQYIMETTIF